MHRFRLGDALHALFPPLQQHALELPPRGHRPALWQRPSLWRHALRPWLPSWRTSPSSVVENPASAWSPARLPRRIVLQSEVASEASAFSGAPCWISARGKPLTLEAMAVAPAVAVDDEALRRRRCVVGRAPSPGPPRGGSLWGLRFDLRVQVRDIPVELPVGSPPALQKAMRVRSSKIGGKVHGKANSGGPRKLALSR